MGRSFVDGAMLSHTGLIRDHNEDVVLYVMSRLDESGPTRDGLALVADGMGGHAAGEVASAIAARTIRLLYYESDDPIPETLAKAFAVANRLIYEQGTTNPEYAGMGTTCTTIAFRDERIWLGHVGDSRAYIVRRGKIHQLSEDHSLVASFVRDGTLTAAEAAASPQRNVILRALGTNPSVEPQIWDQGLAVSPGDIIVLCSDGLNDLVDDTTIAAIVSDRSPHDACQALIDAALSGGGTDNVSVGVFKVCDEAAPGRKAQPVTRTTDVSAALGSRQ